MVDLKQRALVALVCEFGLERPDILRLTCSDIVLVTSSQMELHLRKRVVSSKNYSKFLPILELYRQTIRKFGEPQRPLFSCTAHTLNNQFKKQFQQTIKQYHATRLS